MKYDPDYIRAVSLVQAHVGETAAKQLFDKLFPVQSEIVAPPRDLRAELNAIVGDYVYECSVRAASNQAGTPSYGGNTIAWIRAFRTESMLGLKQAKDAHDFLRDNPSTFA